VEWVQIYNPCGSALLSTLLAGLPIVLLLGMLLVGVSAPRAAATALGAALAVAIFGFGMPRSAAFAAAGYGACFGLLPIGWIVFCAIFLYQLTVRAGQFEIVKRSVAAISPDRRIQALLIAFSLGSFLEGAAGFGTPVAISAALLIGIGFSPLYAAGLALLANTAPVAFGALGTPIITLAKVAGISEMALSQMAGRQLPLFSLIIPFWLVAIMSGWRGIKGCWPAILVCGGSFAGIQFVFSNFHGPTLVDVLGGVGSLIILTVFLQFWQPREIWRFPDEQNDNTSDSAVSGPVQNGDKSQKNSPGNVPQDKYPLLPLKPRQVAYAWMPWILLSLMVFLWGWPSWKTMLDGGTAERPNCLQGIGKFSFNVPGLHNLIYRTAPVVKIPPGSDRAAKPEEARLDFNWLSTTGTGIFIASVLSAVWLRFGLLVFLEEFHRTLFRVRWALLTIACMLALAFVTKYSGADATLGLAFTHTGWLYPFFAPLLGWLGVALTGSDTSANALFGSLQRITAEQLKLNSLLIVASNSTGGVMGKMIDAQSIVVAAVATGQTGSEGRILRFVFLHSLVLAILIGLLTLAQAYLLPWMIPGG
jgi:lactate permease